jgi:hypothetical protein
MHQPKIKRRAGLCVRGLMLSFCFLFAASPFSLSSLCFGQEVVDRMVAAVNGVSTGLITYSDLLWQMALQPDTPLSNPSQESLNAALQLIISQRLILQEAEKLPTITPTDEEVKKELALLIQQFSSQAEFQQRVARVGLNADQLREIVRQRVAIQKYLDFRFRSFTVITSAEVAAYYRDTYVPRLRRQTPGVIVPELDKVRDQIESILTESKIESDTDAFLDEARNRAEIVYLAPGFK